MKTIVYNSHKIEIQGWFKERVFYNGTEVSSKVSVLGSTHVFRVSEDGEDIQYDVQLGTRWHGCSWWCEVRRQGIVIYTDR